MEFFDSFSIGSVNSRPAFHTTLVPCDRPYAVSNLEVHAGVKLNDTIPILLER